MRSSAKWEKNLLRESDIFSTLARLEYKDTLSNTLPTFGPVSKKVRASGTSRHIKKRHLTTTEDMHAENTFGPLDEEFDQALRFDLDREFTWTGTGRLYIALPPSTPVLRCRPTPPPDECDRNSL